MKTKFPDLHVKIHGFLQPLVNFRECLKIRCKDRITNVELWRLSGLPTMEAHIKKALIGTGLAILFDVAATTSDAKPP